MKRYGQIIKVKPHMLQTYKKLHANPPKEVNSMIKACNIRNYSIYNYNDLLFAYFEYIGDDFEADMKLMAKDENTKKWWSQTDPCQEPIESGKWWLNMQEVYHLN